MPAMHNMFPGSTVLEMDVKTAALLGRAGDGPSLEQYLREMSSLSAPTRRRIPSSALLRRDLISSTFSAGQALIGTQSAGALLQQMERYSIFAESGLKAMSGLDCMPLTLPTVKTMPTAAWLSADGQTMTQSEPTFGQNSLTPNFACAYMVMSRQLLMQSKASQVASDVAVEALARAVDTAILAGTGLQGQPRGILNTTGFNTQAGSSLAAAGLRSMQRKVLDAGAREDRLFWVGAQDVQETIGARELSTGGGRYLWDERKILGAPAIATSTMPAGALLVGDFSRVFVAIFDGDGIEVEWNPFHNFRSGQIAFRLLVPVDVSISPAAAFSVATSIT